MYPKRLEVAKNLKEKDPKKLNMVLGMDGFVDEIIHLVDKWDNPSTYKRIEKMNDLAKRIEKASGLSTNIELIPLQKKIGGNGPIMCNALRQHGSSIVYIGALGAPHIDEVFTEMAASVTCYSIANNGHTDALEFHDGKIMLGKMAYLNEITYDNIISHVGYDHLKSYIEKTDLLATVNWSMIPHMTEIWHDLKNKLLSNITPKSKKPIFFVDLADPEKRGAKDIQDALFSLKSFNTHFDVILGLNKKEAFDVSKALNLHQLTEMPEDLKVLAKPLYEALGIKGILIHPVDRSCIMIDDTYYEELGPYVKEPKLTTGAGDNFNAGAVLGLLLGLSPDQALLCGMATSGFYVRKAYSPSYTELIQFLEDWSQDNL